MKNYKSIILLLGVLLSLSAWSNGGPCSDLRPWYSCTPSCGSYCTYYTFEEKTISMDIRKLPTDLSPLKPTGNFCDHEAEDHREKTVRKIPYDLGPYDPTDSPTVTPVTEPTGPYVLRKLPTKPVLKYKKWTRRIKFGGICPSCRPESCHPRVCSSSCGTSGYWITCSYRTYVKSKEIPNFVSQGGVIVDSYVEPEEIHAGYRVNITFVRPLDGMTLPAGAISNYLASNRLTYNMNCLELIKKRALVPTTPALPPTRMRTAVRRLSTYKCTELTEKQVNPIGNDQVGFPLSNSIL